MLETSLFVTAIATLGMLSPGPDFFLIVRNAICYPRPVAMTSALGVILGVATHMSYCVAGLAVVISTTPWLFNILKYAGAAYLIWIGLQALFSKQSQSRQDEAAAVPISLRRAFVQGYLCNLLNPKATLFFFSVFTQVLSLNSSLFEKLWYAWIIWILAVIWWPLLIVLIQTATARRIIDKAQRWIDKALGGVLIALGVKVALTP